MYPSTHLPSQWFFYLPFKKFTIHLLLLHTSAWLLSIHHWSIQPASQPTILHTSQPSTYLCMHHLCIHIPAHAPLTYPPIHASSMHPATHALSIRDSSYSLFTYSFIQSPVSSSISIFMAGICTLLVAVYFEYHTSIYLSIHPFLHPFIHAFIQPLFHPIIIDLIFHSLHFANLSSLIQSLVYSWVYSVCIYWVPMLCTPLCRGW